MKKIIEEYREIILNFDRHISWKDLKNTQGISDDDFIDELNWKFTEDKSKVAHFSPILTVYSKREETDEEYEKRLASEKSSKNILESIQYNEYLKLKKIYEPDSK
jgi:hypothetical protein